MHLTWWHTHKISLHPAGEAAGLILLSRGRWSQFLLILQRGVFLFFFNFLNFYSYSHLLHPTPSPRTDWAPASLIHRLRLFEGQKGGHPVYRDHWVDWDWLRRDSLIKCASAIGHRAGAEEGAEGRKRRRGGVHRALFRRNRVGSRGGGYSGQRGICRQCPVSQKFRFHWWDLSSTVLWLPIISSYGLRVKLEHPSACY